MAYRVQLTPKSVEDLESIVEFYLSQNDRAADVVYQSIIQRVSSLEEFPDRGRVVPEFLDEGMMDYRELIVGNFRIIYRHDAKAVEVIRIIDSRKLFEMKIQ